MNSEDIAAVDDVVALHGKTPDKAIPVLQAVQGKLRHVPTAAIERVASTTDMTEAQLYGVATFYSQFRLEPVGETVIKVCHGTACHVGGAEGVTEALEMELGMKDGETTPDMKYTLTSVACVGCCSLAPVMMVVDDRTYGRLDRKKAASIVQGLSEASESGPGPDRQDGAGCGTGSVVLPVFGKLCPED